MSSSASVSTGNISPPQSYTVPSNVRLRIRLTFLLFNYINQPYLMNAIIVGRFFAGCPLETIHFIGALTIGNPLHDPHFRGVGLDSLSTLHLINIRIKTAVQYTGPEAPGRYWYVHRTNPYATIETAKNSRSQAAMDCQLRSGPSLNTVLRS
jgi:hypothetical protein